MQIHISWKAILAGLVFLIACGLLLRVVVGQVAPEAPATNPTAIAAGSPDSASEPTVGATHTTTSTPPAPTAEPVIVATETTAPTATATTEPTATPEPTALPPTATPFQPPTRVPPPPPAQLEVVVQGFGQNENAMSYAFVIRNPSPDQLAQDVTYQVALFDERGLVLTTDSGTIDLIGPGQQMGAAKLLRIAPGVVVSRMEVNLLPGQFVQGEQNPVLLVENSAFGLSVPPLPSLTGILRNPLNRDLSNVRVIGLVYDDAGIVGGGDVIVPFIGANGQIPFSIAVATTMQPSRFEFYFDLDADP